MRYHPHRMIGGRELAIILACGLKDRDAPLIVLLALLPPLGIVPAVRHREIHWLMVLREDSPVNCYSPFAIRAIIIQYDPG